MGFWAVCTHLFGVKWRLQRYANGATKVHGPDHGQYYPFGECELHGGGALVSSGLEGCGRSGRCEDLYNAWRRWTTKNRLVIVAR